MTIGRTGKTLDTTVMTPLAIHSCIRSSNA
jgi:hypothetical protein